LDGNSDPAAADAFFRVEDWVWIIEKDRSLRAPAGQHLDIARSILSEAPVWANRKGLKVGKSLSEFHQKGGRFLLGSGGIKG
jgi:hypothetical protein